MNHNTLIAIPLLGLLVVVNSKTFARDPGTGNISLGTRNTLSSFNHDDATGLGIGGQFRFQFNDRLNSEWYADYIPSQTKLYHREDYHIGWSVMYYFTKNYGFEKVMQPYLIAGHCFDYSVVKQNGLKSNFADRFSSATQAGIGTHFNITKRLDCSLAAQYMLHFGKEIEVENHGSDKIEIRRSEFVSPDGHFLFTLSFNYKFVNFWSGWK